MSPTYHFIAQAVPAVAAEPNFMLIGIILGIMVILAIAFLIPLKEPKALEDGSKKKALPEDKKESPKALDAKPEIDKDKMSLSEIKESKRASVSEEKTKEELRELRRERRADTQTEKAIQEREDVEEIKENSSSVAPKAEETTEDVSASESSEKVIKAAIIEEAAETKEESAEQSDDIFSTLFGKEASEEEDEFDEFASTSDVASAFPTLGSALIPLDKLTEEAEKSNNEIASLDDFAQNFADEAEKKTLS